MSSKTLEGIRSIEDFELEDKRLFLRLDLNVPLKKGEITDDTRLRASLPTIHYAIDKGAKIVLASHLGRPKSQEDRSKLSLEPVAAYLNRILDKEIILIEDPASEAPKALLAGLKPSQIILLENLRFAPGEEKNDHEFAAVLAEYIDIYINDAFGASHRAHASIVALPQAVGENIGIGLLMKKEIEMLDRVRFDSEHPYVAILGGAKVSDKIDVIEVLIDKVDSLIIGGAMAYTFLAAQNIPVGRSLVEKDKIKFAADLLKRMEARGRKILLPVDHLVVSNLSDVQGAELSKGVGIAEDKMAVDIGPQSQALFAEEVAKAKTVFWNGPMGIFETPEFSQGTFKIAEAMAHSKAITIVGGGDSAAAAHASGYAEQMSHISTGGGASLEYLQGLRLPGLEVMRPAKRSEK